MKKFTIKLTPQNLTDLLEPDCGVTTAVIPEMTPDFVAELCRQASKLVYTKAQHTSKVKQNFTCCGKFERESIWTEMARQFTDGIQKSLVELESGHLFTEPLKFTDLALQEYSESMEECKYGISPHSDQSGFINLVVVLLLRGPAVFYICKDREGFDAKEIQAEPGNLIIMRGGGFAGGTLSRPIHFVGPIDKRGRLSFGLRQVTSDEDAAKRLREYFNG